MKKILSLSVMALLLMGLVGGGTWAYFSDTESASGNELVAGTLDLGLSTSSGDASKPTGGLSIGVSTDPDWAPGGTQDITIYLYNSGTIDMEEVTIQLTNGVFTDGTPPSVHPVENPPLSTDFFMDMVNVKSVTYGGVAIVNDDLTGKTLEQLHNEGGAPLELVLGALAAGGEAEFAITFEFDKTATNGCQGDKYAFDMTFTGYQKENKNAIS